MVKNTSEYMKDTKTWLIIAIMHFTADVKLQPEKIQACVHLKTMQHDIAFLEW